MEGIELLMPFNNQKFIRENDEAPIEIVVRPAINCDARAILGLLQQVGRETDYLVTGPKGSSYTIDQQRQLLEEYQKAPRSILLVAEVDDQLVGIANVSALDQNRQSHVAEVGVALVQEYWGYGVGSILVEETIRFARHSSIEVLTLEVVAQNQRAIGLYEKFGFELTGRHSKRLKVEYAYYDTHTMELIL